MRRFVSVVLIGTVLLSGICGCGARRAEPTADTQEQALPGGSEVINTGTQEPTDGSAAISTETQEPAEMTSEATPQATVTDPLAAVAPSTAASDPTVVEEDDAAGKEQPQTIHYIDAWGEWHDMTVDQQVRKHPYQWDKLSRDGEALTYDDGSYTIRKGIDVSHHQGEIDWARVKADGCEFAIIRIAYRGYGEEGKLMEDRAQAEYIKAAHEAGLDVGVYIFSQAINEEEAREEAEFVIDLLSDVDLELPVVYDPELIRDDVARTDNVSGEQFTRNTILFCDMIKAAGHEPMVYSNMIWESELFDMRQIEQYPVWYADYEPAPQTPYDFAFWQYSESGHVDGVEGEVDLNVQFLKQ